MGDGDDREITLTWGEIKETDNRIKALENHDIFKIWTSVRKGGKTTLDALIKNAQGIRALEKKLEVYSHFIDEHQMVLDNQERMSDEIAELKEQTEKKEHWTDKSNIIQTILNTYEKNPSLHQLYFSILYEQIFVNINYDDCYKIATLIVEVLKYKTIKYCSFYAGGDANGDCMLYGSNDITKSQKCEDINCQYKASGGENLVARVKERKDELTSYPIEAEPCKPTTDSKLPEPKYYEYEEDGYKIRTRKKRPDLLDEVLGTKPKEAEPDFVLDRPTKRDKELIEEFIKKLELITKGQLYVNKAIEEYEGRLEAEREKRRGK